MGLPGCVMYSKRTVFDLILPRIMADDKVSAEELAHLGEGGLCLDVKFVLIQTVDSEKDGRHEIIFTKNVLISGSEFLWKNQILEKELHSYYH